MRKDYKYIENAIDLNLIVTDKGDEYIENKIDQVDDFPPSDKILNFLILAQDEYIIVPKKSSIGDWLESINKTILEYTKDEDLIVDNLLLTKEDLTKLINDELIGFRIVIWDERTEEINIK